MDYKKQEEEFLQQIKKKMSKDNYAALTGVEIIKAAPGYAMTKLIITEQHLNAAGVVQGGAIFTLADYALAAAANYGAQTALVIECQLSFISSARGGILWAETEQLADSKSFGSYAVRVTNEQSQLIAQYYGRVYKMR